MNGIVEMGKVCKLGEILFVQYRTSPVLTENNTFYLNQSNGKTTNFFTPSITQWHWNPNSEVEKEELEKILLNAKEVINCEKHDDMWFKHKMIDVMKVIQ